MIKICKIDTGEYGLFLTNPVKKDDVIYKPTTLTKEKIRSIYTIEFDDGHYYNLYLKNINHSCEPTAWVDKVDKSIKALRDLNEGSEITFDYQKNEAVISNPFGCLCGFKSCRGFIGQIVCL